MTTPGDERERRALIWGRTGCEWAESVLSLVCRPREEGLERAGRLMVAYVDQVNLEFIGEVWFWRGPSPYHFVPVPPDESTQIQAMAARVTYGSGMIPVEVRIGSTRWTTSLFPKDGGYVVPLKDLVRRAESIDVGDTVTLGLAVDV